MITNDFNKPSIVIAIDAINKATGHRFTRRDITLADIEYLDEGYYNSQAKIVPVPGSVYYDEVTIQYDRFNILKLFHGVDVTIPLGNQKTLADFLPIINKRYGLSLDKDDIINGVIPEDATLPFRVLIQIDEDNPAFLGYIPVTFIDDEVSLTYILAKTDNAFSIEEPYEILPEETDKLIVGETLLLDYDYTEYSNKLGLLTIGTIANNIIESALDSHPLEWHNAPYTMENNLFKAEVVYNGVMESNEQIYTPVNRDFTDVLVLKLNPTYCDNITGNLIFRYRR